MKKIENEIYDSGSRVSDLFNTEKFIGRVASCLVEDGFDINLGDYITKSHIHGHIKVLKTLGLYKVTGRGATKMAIADDKLLMIILTTIASAPIISKTIIKLVNGDYIGLKFGDINLENYNKLIVDIVNNPLPNYCTYLFMNRDCGLIKIGRSKDVFKRLYGVQSDAGTKNVDIVAYKNTDIESILHVKYRFYRKYGEWFDLPIDIVLDIINENNFENIINKPI